MSIVRIYTIFLRQLYLFRGRAFRLLDIFYWPLLDIFLWGTITLYLHRVGGAQLGFISIFIGAIIMLQFLTKVQHGVSIAFLEDVWTRNFMNLFATPLSIAEYTVGLLLTSFFRTLASIIFMTFVAWLLFAYNIFQFGFFLVPFLAVLFVFGIAFGIFATALMLRFGPSAEFLAWTLPAFLTPFSGVFYPISALPSFFQHLARVLPPAYVFEGMRSVVISGALDMRGLITAFGLSVLYLLIGYFFLYRTYRLVLRRGLFARFIVE